MQSNPVDLRDPTWAINQPKYRVYFHDDTASDEYELHDGDLPRCWPGPSE